VVAGSSRPGAVRGAETPLPRTGWWPGSTGCRTPGACRPSRRKGRTPRRRRDHPGLALCAYRRGLVLAWTFSFRRVGTSAPSIRWVGCSGPRPSNGQRAVADPRRGVYRLSASIGSLAGWRDPRLPRASVPHRRCSRRRPSLCPAAPGNPSRSGPLPASWPNPRSPGPPPPS